MKDKDNYEEFLATYLTFGVVIKADIDTIKKLKEFISKLENSKIIYQKLDIKNMYLIVKD